MTVLLPDPLAPSTATRAFGVQVADHGRMISVPEICLPTPFQSRPVMRLLLAHNSAVGGKYKLQEFGAFGACVDLALDFAHCLRRVESALVQQAVGVVNFFDAGVAESAAAKADGVDAFKGERFAGHGDERRNVFADQGSATDHHVRADFDELVHGRQATENGPVADFDMAGEGDTVDKDDVVPDDAVVGDMGVGHDQAFFAEGGFAVGFGSAVDGCTFSNNAAVSQKDLAVFAAELEVLGHSADDGALVNAAVLAEARTGEHVAAAHDPGSVTQHGVVLDHGKGIDADVSGNFGVRMDRGEW